MEYYVVDAFTDEVFSGNPAGVCLAPAGLDATTMQRIAAENNLAETAFLTKRGDVYDLRWFTPQVEVDLCGHATLASAFIIATVVDPAASLIRFQTRSGELTATPLADRYVLDFPARPPIETGVTPAMPAALGVPVLEAWTARDLMLVLEDEDQVKNLQPDLAAVSALTPFGVIVTAASATVDFVSRFFAPNVGVDEDPVTGSAHATLIPYWADRLHKDDMTARQVSPRGGTLFCRNAGDRVKIAGQARLYLRGEILPYT